MYVRADLTATNCTLSDNKANVRGGGIYAESGSVVLVNVTLTQNRADSADQGLGSGGGIYNDLATITLHNAIIAL